MSFLDDFSNLIFNVYEAFTVAVFLKENESLKCITSMTFPNSFNRNKSIPVEGTLPGWVVKHNEPLIIPNFDKDEDALGYYDATEGIKSFMGYPIEGKGVIIIDSKRKWAFTDKEKKILGAFASILYNEIEREKRFFDIEERIDELYTERRIINLFNELNLARISIDEIFRECLAVSGADFCFTGIEKSGKMFIHNMFGIIPGEYVTKECLLGGSIASTVMEGGRELLLPYNSGLLREKPLFFSEETIKVKQLFGYPLIVDDSVIGVVGFVSISDTRLGEQSIAILRDVSMLLSLYYSSLWMKENLEKLRDFEPITGSIQFPVFLKILENMIKRGDRLSLISVKLTNLYMYNKYMGLDFTNNLLKKVFQIIRYCVGSHAFITREGGGHFYILLRGDEKIDTKNLIRILDYTTNKGICEEKISDVSAGVEIGVASLPEDGKMSIWELLDKAEGKINRPN